MANGQQTLNTGRVGHLKGLAGPADDITPHHYGMCDIYRMFGDAVYVMVPATIICKTVLPVPCTLTVSWVSVTKAGGLSNTPGAEKKGHWTGKLGYCDTLP